MIVVYKLTRADGKEYIGKSANFKNRLCQHRKSKRFNDIPILKYEILIHCQTHEEALKYEKFFIEEYDTYNNGLNNSKDGTGNHNSKKFTTQGFKFSEKSKNKMSKTAKKNNKIKHARKWYNSLTEEQRIEFHKLHSIKTKGKPKPTKIKKEIVEDILYSFKEKIELPNVGEKRRNGKKMSYRQAFALHYSKKYNIAPRTVINLIENKTLSWKPLYEKILGIKS